MNEKHHMDPVEIDELQQIDSKNGELSFRELFKKSIWAIVVLMVITGISLFLIDRAGLTDAEFLKEFIDTFEHGRSPDISSSWS